MTHSPSRSSTFLTGLSTLLLALGVGFLSFMVAGAVFGFGLGGDEVAVHAIVDADRIGDLPSGSVAVDNIDVVVRVQDATAEQLRWFAVRDLPSGILVLVVLWLVRGLLASVRDGDAFIHANVTRLRALALVLLVGVPVAEALRSIFASELATTANLVGPSIQLTVPGNALLGGLAVLVLGEVFASGIRLRGDLEGTV